MHFGEWDIFKGSDYLKPLLPLIWNALESIGRSSDSFFRHPSYSFRSETFHSVATSFGILASSEEEALFTQLLGVGTHFTTCLRQLVLLPKKLHWCSFNSENVHQAALPRTKKKFCPLRSASRSLGLSLENEDPSSFVLIKVPLAWPDFPAKYSVG